MGPITVNQLLRNLTELKAKGYGNAPIFVADDEECNGYHALWYIGETAGEMPADRKADCEELNCDLCVLKDRKMAVYMG
jgi:hypothetical protein